MGALACGEGHALNRQIRVRSGLKGEPTPAEFELTEGAEQGEAFRDTLRHWSGPMRRSCALPHREHGTLAFSVRGLSCRRAAGA